MIGRYASVDVLSIQQQAWWLTQAGVDIVVVDWTNNLWSQPTWDSRQPNIQELVNATDLHIGVYAALARDNGWPVPRFVLLLGLDNGPITPLPALEGELDYIVSAYLANETVGPNSLATYLGKPLVLIFDGTGADHSDYSHPNFTIRWMSSQNQETRFNKKGYWSWMDGAVDPEITDFQGKAEVATVAPAFFAGGGWTNSASAMGRSGGLTYVQEVVNVLQATVGQGLVAPSFLMSCQWNEYAGQANGGGTGPNSSTYVDSYSADLSNDIEPTSPYACGYARPGVACGGWGYRAMNVMAMMNAAATNAALLDDALMLSVLTPRLGDFSNYTSGCASGNCITASWVMTAFNSSALAAGEAYAYNVSLPVSLEIDGATVMQLAADVNSAVIDVDTAGPFGAALDRRFPHIMTVTAQMGAPGAASDSLSSFPLSFDYFDESVPLQERRAAAGTAWIRLPESL